MNKLIYTAFLITAFNLVACTENGSSGFSDPEGDTLEQPQGDATGQGNQNDNGGDSTDFTATDEETTQTNDTISPKADWKSILENEKEQYLAEMARRYFESNPQREHEEDNNAQDENEIDIAAIANSFRERHAVDTPSILAPSKTAPASIRDLYTSPKSIEETDTNGDGQIDKTVKYFRDGHKEIHLDQNYGGTIDKIIYEYYNKEGELYKTTWDENADGSIDYVSNRIFNEDGKAIGSEIDRNNDGEIDSKSFLVFDEDGNWVGTRFDHDNDGNIDTIMSFVTGENENETETHFDSDADGYVDSISYYRNQRQYKVVRYVRNEFHQIIEEHRDNDGNGTVDEIIRY